MIIRTLETRPKHATHWSTRTMAEASGLNQNAIVRIWRVFGLKPHLQENFKLSTDPFFVEKVRDIVGLYVNPPVQTRAVVPCVDEKRQVQAPTGACPCAPAKPSGARMITTATAPPRPSPRWTWPRARSLAGTSAAGASALPAPD